jgi:hypothetical protein
MLELLVYGVIALVGLWTGIMLTKFIYIGFCSIKDWYKSRSHISQEGHELV